MTGPEHYRAAERLVRTVEEWAQKQAEAYDDPRRNSALVTPAHIECAKAAAQVHATLAAAPDPAVAKAVDFHTRLLWATSQNGRMIIDLAGQIQGAVDALRQAAGLPEIG